MGIAFTIFIIISLIYIYKKREDEEKYLALKVVGYYLLGSFNFNINSLAIPLGMAIYLIFFRPTINKNVKKLAATFGFIIFCMGVVVPKIETAIFQKSVLLPLSSTNISSIDFIEDLNVIRDRFNMKNQLIINMFDVTYGEDGEINNIYMQIEDYTNEDKVNYTISYVKGQNEGKYYINRNKNNNITQFEKPLDADYLLKNINIIKGEKIHSNFEEYSIILLGTYGKYGINDPINIFIGRDNSRKTFSNTDSPVSGAMIKYSAVHLVNDSNVITGEDGNATAIPEDQIGTYNNAKSYEINYILEN